VLGISEMRAVAKTEILMHGQVVKIRKAAAECRKELRIPLRRIVPDTDQFQPRRQAEPLEVDAILTKHVGVFGGRHLPAATPGLIADTPPLHVIGSAVAVAPAHGRVADFIGAVAVLQPVNSVAGRAGPDISTQIWLGVKDATERHELVRSERVRLLAQPPVIRTGDALVGRADAILPAVSVGETASRPPKSGWLNALQRLNDVEPDSLLVRNRGVWPDPDALIHHAADMFDEVAIDQG